MVFSIILIIYFLVFAILAWRRLDWATYLVIFALPSYLIRFQILNIPATVLEGMILIVFVVWLVRKLTTNNLQLTTYKDFGKFLWPTALFLLAATISVFTAPELRAAAGVWKAFFIEPVLFLIVLVDTIRTKERLRGVMWALGLSILVPGLIAIYQKFSGAFIPNPFWQAEATRRVTSVYGFPNAIGLYFAPIVMLFIGILAAKFKHNSPQSPLTLRGEEKTSSPWCKRRLRGVSLLNYSITQLLSLSLLIIIGLLSTAFALSKGALLGIFLGLVFFALFWKGYRKIFAGILVLLVLIGLIVSQADGGLLDNLTTLEGTKTISGGGSLEVRLEQWGEAWQMLKNRPILGAGLSGYQEWVEPYHEQEHIEIFLYPHQIVLNFWSETGLLGLIAFIWLLVLFFKNTYNLQLTTYNWPVAGATVALLAHGLVDVPYFKNDLSVLFWTLIGLLIIMNQPARAEQLES